MGFWGDLAVSLIFDKGGVLETAVNIEEETLDKLDKIEEDAANENTRDKNGKISDVPDYSKYDVTQI